MMKLLIGLVAIFFVINVIVWTALFNNAGGPARGPAPSSVAVSTAVPAPAAVAPTVTRGPSTVPFLGGAPVAPTAAPAPTTTTAALPAVAGASRPFSTVIRDADLNPEINRYLARQGAPPLRDVSVEFGAERALLRGRATVAGLDVPVRASGPIVVRNGRPAFLVQSLDIGSVTVPEALRGGVVDAVNETTRRLTSDLGAEITDIKMGEGHIVVSGRVTS